MGTTTLLSGVDLVLLAEPVHFIGLALREAELRPARRRVDDAVSNSSVATFADEPINECLAALQRFQYFISVSHVCYANVVRGHALLDELVPPCSVSDDAYRVELVASR